MSPRRLTAFVALLAVVAAVSLPDASAGAQQQASLPDIEDEVMCPICGTTLEMSEAPQAERERALIRGLIAEGRSKEEVKDALVAEYGEEVLAVPDDTGFDLAAWIVPAAGIALIAILGAWSLRRGRQPDRERAELAPADAERLRRDLSRHDL